MTLFYRYIIVTLLWLAAFPSNAQLNDTIILDQTEVTDYSIKANQTFKEDLILTDSLTKTGRITLAEAIAQNTSIFVKSYGGNGVANLALRGTGASHTNVYWNNLDISSPGLGQTDFSTLPANAFDRIQLQYGFASLTDGSGGLGGSIRLSNKADFADNITKLSISQMAGSFGQLQTTANISVGSKKFRSQTGAYYFSAINNYNYPDITEQGWPQKELQNSQYAQLGVYQNLFYRISEGKLLSLKSWYNTVDRQLPPPITGNPNNYNELKDNSFAAIAEYQQGSNKKHFLINSGLVKADNIFTSGGDSASSNNQFLSWQTNVRYSLSINKKLTLETGAHYRLESAKSEYYTSELIRHRGSVFGELNYKFSQKWLGTILLREEFIAPDFSPLLASFGAKYQWTKKLSLRFNAAHNYRYPSLNDLYWTPGGNPNLKPEDSYSLEGGLNHQIKFNETHHLNYGITAFYNSVDNWIQWAPSGFYWSPQNIKKVENAGMEVDITARQKYAEHITFHQQVHYSYTRALTTAIYGNLSNAYLKQLIYVPYHKGVFGFGISYKNWELRYSQQFTDRYFISADNETYMPAYTVAQLSMLHNNILNNQNHLLSAAIRINNLYDMPYQTIPYRPEPGINLSLQLTYSPSF